MTTAQLATTSDRMKMLNAYLAKAAPAIKDVVPKHLTPERMIKLVAAAASRQPEILECTPLSIVQALVIASSAGLEINTPMGLAYLIAYRNGKTQTREAQLIIGYRGLIELARRSGMLVSIEAHVVHERDRFEFAFGLEPKLVHEPYMGSGEEGALIAVYAVAHLKDGGRQIEVMRIADVDKIRTRSKAGNYGPWVTDYEEMCKKTVLKRLCKLLPMSIEMGTAVAADNVAEHTVERPGSQLEAVNAELADTLVEGLRRSGAEKDTSQEVIDIEDRAKPKDKGDELLEKLNG